MYDIIVVGGGAAGMTAALYALRNGKSALVIEKTGFGLVCDNTDDALCKALSSLLDDPLKIESRHEMLLGRAFDDEGAVERFEEVLAGGAHICQ